MRVSVIKKSLIKQSIILLIILSVIGSGTYYIITLDEECDQNINSIKSQADGIAKQAMDLSTEYNKVNSDMALYEEIKKKQDNKQLTLSRILLRDIISSARSKYLLDSLDVKMGEVKPMESPDYRRETMVIESSGVSISTNTLTDIDAIGLIQALEKSLWGVKFSSLKISLSKDIDSTTLIAIKDTGFTPIISTKMNFTLFGLQKVGKGENELLTEGGPEQGGDKSPIRLRQQ